MKKVIFDSLTPQSPSWSPVGTACQRNRSLNVEGAPGRGRESPHTRVTMLAVGKPTQRAPTSKHITGHTQGRSLTTATGRAVVGSLHVRTSSHATTGNTQATGHSSVRNVTGPSQGQTTLLFIWKDTYETCLEELSGWRWMKALEKYTYMLVKPWTNLWPTLLKNHNLPSSCC